MMRPMGESFAPTTAADGEKKPTAAQQAIQVLSMRLPRIRGARAISPLVGEPGSAARREQGGFSPDSAVLQTLMRARGASIPPGSAPGAASEGASDPMSAALAALGGGMMNAAPVVTPGIADPRNPPPIDPSIINAPTPAPTIVPGSPTIPLPAPEERQWRADPSAPARVPRPSQGLSPSAVPPPPGPKGYSPEPTAPAPPEPGGVDPRMMQALIDMLGRRGF